MNNVYRTLNCLIVNDLSGLGGSLEHLHVFYTQLSENSLRGLINLKSLRIVDSSFTSEMFTRELVNLESLYISDGEHDKCNQLDLSRLINLKRLNLDKLWRLKDLESASPHLTHLIIQKLANKIDENEFREIIQRFTNLEHVSFLCANQMTNFDVNWLSDVSCLKFLCLKRCGLTNVNLVPNDENCRLENLEEINLSHNKLTEFSSKAALCLSNLKYLDLSSNCLTTIHRGMFRPLNNLINLNLSGNKIESIEDNVFADLVSLESLSLDNNQLVHSTFAGLKRLVNLSLKGNKLNKLTSTTLVSLASLKNLDIGK